jgi:S-adenosylmethionine:tRNA ribosyltransferase-isomerase
MLASVSSANPSTQVRSEVDGTAAEQEFTAGQGEARGPIEQLTPGASRDHIRLMVMDAAGHVAHARFDDIGHFLPSEALLVVNDSATLAAAVEGTVGGQAIRVHLSAPVPYSSRRLVEFREPEGYSSRERVPLDHGERVLLPGDGQLTVTGGLLGTTPRDRLRQAELALPTDLPTYLRRHGMPIRYGYVSAPWNLSDYQTVFARVAGSSEMPSAGRPFSRSLCAELQGRGISVAPITLHTGVTSLGKGELPCPEPFEVSTDTAEQLNTARQEGRAIIAVGTSVVRALHTTLTSDGAFVAAGGFTDRIVRPPEPIRCVDGMVTGWHEPEASHLLMLSAITESAQLRWAYLSAAMRGYLWHEFGDSLLILRGRTLARRD